MAKQTYQNPTGRGPGRPPDQELVKFWQSQVDSANKVYMEWEEEFECDRMEEYLEGKQWEERLRRNRDNTDPKDHYQVNRILAGHKTRMPMLMFYRPKAHFTPKPAREDDQGSTLDDISKLYEDTFYTFARDEKVGFFPETKMAVRDAQTRFGVVEVGYSADYLDNPNAGRPILKKGIEDSEEAYANPANYVTDSKGKSIPQPQRVPKSGSEMLYVKRIPACQFRFSPNTGHDLREADWYGYYTYEYVEDLQKNPTYDNTSKLKEPTVRMKDKYQASAEGSDSAVDSYSRAMGMLKVWRIWDRRAKVKRVFVDGKDFFLKKDEPFTYTPLRFLVFEPRPDKGPYPIPPYHSWLSPQDEYNDTRDARRIHRRRMIRRYTAIRGRILDPELAKIESGGDGAIAWAEAENALLPVADAPLDRQVVMDTQDARTDFSEASGVPSEQRGIADSSTATQASIVDTNAKVRDSDDRQKVATFLAEIAKLMIMTLRDNMILKFWIQVNADPRSPAYLQEASQITAKWREITRKDLGEFDFDVEIDIESMVPMTDDLQRNQWTQLLATLANPQLMIALSASEVLLKKTVTQYGVRSPKEIAEIQAAMRAVLQITVPQAASVLWGVPNPMMGPGASPQPGMPTAPGGAMPPPSGPASGGMGAPAPQNPADIASQLAGQTGVKPS